MIKERLRDPKDLVLPHPRYAVVAKLLRFPRELLNDLRTLVLLVHDLITLRLLPLGIHGHDDFADVSNVLEVGCLALIVLLGFVGRLVCGFSDTRGCLPFHIFDQLLNLEAGPYNIELASQYNIEVRHFIVLREHILPLAVFNILRVPDESARLRHPKTLELGQALNIVTEPFMFLFDKFAHYLSKVVTVENYERCFWAIADYVLLVEVIVGFGVPL